MKRVFLFLCALTFFIAAVPTHTGLLTDKAGILTVAERQDIEGVLRSYAARTNNEFAVLIVPSLDGEDIKSYSTNVFHEWGIGKKGANNGLLFLWSVGDRRMRFEVGYGLEAYLNDGKAGEILRTVARPAFAQQQWHDGLKATVLSAINTLDRRGAVDLAPPVPNDGVPLWTIILVLVCVAVFFLIWYIIHRQNHDLYEDIEAPFSSPSDGFVVLPTYTPPTNTVQYSSAPTVYDPTPRREDDSPSSSSSSDSGWSSGGSSDFSFGGGDSGGGGADASY